jgi:hypothetical protein
MRTGDLTNGQISRLDPHIGQVEKEQSALFHELVSLREVRTMIMVACAAIPITPELDKAGNTDTPIQKRSNLEHVFRALADLEDADWGLSHLEGAIADEYKD